MTSNQQPRDWTSLRSSLNFICPLVLLSIFAGQAFAAQVTLSDLAKTYSGGSQSATVVTNPPGLSVSVTYTGVDVTYAGSTTPPTNAGSYAVVATIVDPGETGSASGTLVISKANQTITMSAVAPKTYGDAPFTVTATSNIGLPITQWQSSDPSVAVVSPSGLVTLVGAGQTSIIASTGNLNYDPEWVAQPLNVARSSASLPSGTQTATYNTTAQGLDPSPLPSGLATEFAYRNTNTPEATATPQVVFQNGPDTLALSYFSVGVQATGTWALAKLASLGGTARKLHSCDVTLVSWARYDTSTPYGYRDWADDHSELVVPPSPNPPGPDISIPGNSGGYYHPVTLSLYEYENQGTVESYNLLTSKTVQVFIPWRPVYADANGTTAYLNNGYAFRVSFSFPDGVVLPQSVFVGVGFNSHTHGTSPVGEPGPYDALNIARPEGQQVGSTLLTSSLFYKNWRWGSASGNTGPMLRLSCVPTNATRVPPVGAGTYEVKTHAAGFESDSASTSTLVIEKAPLEVNLTDLVQVRDGSPKPAGVTTSPAGIATSLTYAGATTAPSGLGSYPVLAVSANPNYEGQDADVLTIGDSFLSWRNAVFAGLGLPPEKTTDTADPDGDGLSNFLEYALNLNPSRVDGSSATGLETANSTMAFTYRKNLHALDLEYALQGTSDLSDSAFWTPVTPLSTSTISDDGSTRVLKAIVAKPSGQARHFIRLSATR